MAEEDHFSDPDEASMDDDGEEGSSLNEGTEDDMDNEDNDFIDDDAPTRFGHLQRSAYLDLSPPDQIAKWHESLLPVEVDLITELDGVNLFFINAESMIIDLLLSGEVAFAEDPQFLRMVFAMEQLLYAIKACGGVARLVFFDKLQKVLTSAFGESVWAFRQAFLCHCKSSGIDHAVFPHWYCSEWKAHISEWRPSFFLVANDAVELEDDEEEEEDEDEKPKDEKPQLREMFRALMLSCLSAKTHAALLRGVQRRGNRMMAFMLEPDCYDSWVDHNIQADLLPVFEEEDEDEEEEEDVLEELQKFKKDCKVDEKALLRSFITVKFCRETLKMVTGGNAVNDQMMSLVVKTLVLKEIMLRQIPLDKRSYSVPAMEEWELYENTIIGGLERFHTMAANSLAKLEKADVPEDLKLESCDLFDGRLYRYIFQALVAHGLKNDGQIGADFFKFAPFVQEDLDVIWKQAGSKEAFFPLDMKSLLDFPGIEPPELPAQEKPRPKPVLQTVDNDFLNSLWKDAKFGTIEEGASEDPPEIKLFDEKHKWNSSGYLDSHKEEEFMEENEAEKKFKAKMAAKGVKMSARDVEWQRKFALKKKQMALKALAAYAKSLTGSDKLHPPIIMKEETAKDKKDDDKSKVKEPEVKKVSGKMAELLEKRQIEEEAKIKAHDAEQLKSWDKTIDSLAEVSEPERFEKELLDCVCGFGRITDSIAGFPAVQTFFKTRDAQAKLVVKVVKACRTSFKKMQLDRMPASSMGQVRRIVRYFFCLLQEGFNSYGKSDLDGKSIKLFQECLIAIGFPTCAKTMYELWKEVQLAKSAKAAEEAKPEDTKGGKDDKKAKASAKKDDKKESKKDDKKDKKDDKKDKKGKASDEPEAAGDKELDQYEVKKEVDKLWSGVGGDEMAFQLEYNGPYMTRTVGTAKDPLGRVSFKPDGWQKDLLDIVDKDESALIVAPTASGKTFIGYYVMDKVLRADNEGVAVYVAPSKALVNQVSAEVYARFSSKTYPAHSKNELLGCFLREYNSAGGVMEVGKWKNCQVLVTIPHILEMILLSPNMQDWVKRLRYVIFDEVHCIGEQEGGAQWEHTMQALPCPFIALSATVADPSFFHGWLNQISKAKGQAEVRIVQHTERWNDLYKYVFTGGQSRPLHPFCCLIVQSVRRNGLASDLTLTPQETCQLFFEVDKIIGKKHKTWGDMAPSKYWTGLRAGYLKKSDVRQYEKEVKALFLEVLRDGTLTNEDFEQLVLNLQNRPADSGAKADDKKFSPPPRAEVADAEEITDFRSMNKRSAYLQGANILKLCKTLDESSQLPALIFNFSRKDIDTMLKRTLKEMKDQQYHKYYGDEDKLYKSKREMERRMAEYNNKMTAYEQSLKAKASKNQESNAARKEGGDEGGRSGGKEANDTSLDVGMMEPEVPLDIADEIDLEFSFHSPKALGQWQEDIKDTINDLKRRKIPQVLIEGLQRGIGMHHEGCRTQYRQAVEILFRRGYLRVVFATGTLALGINMPCRTAIFCGDSLELNGLMFRQMSGRAGRRGFDLLGQVVFLDMSFLKVRRLIASDLSTLTGEFQLSSTTLLRVLDCWEHLCTYAEQDKTLARSKEDVARTLGPMYSLPFFSSETADLDTQVKYHSRFSVELLRKEGLLNKLAFPSGLQSFVSHMFEIEPANLILCRLLGSGLIHEYLNAEKKKEIKGERRTHLTVKLMSVLGWLIFRKRLPASYAKTQPRKKWLPSEGSPRLPPLPPKILEEVQKYNASIFELFQQLSWSVACTRKFRECDFMLPCSHRQFPSEFGQAPMEKDSSFQSGLIGQRVRFKARSPLAAISGGGDYFTSPHDLVTNLRNVIQMDMNALPIVPPAPGQAGATAALEDTNSWALDYMIHGKTKYLWEDNAIDSTKAYKLISGFKDKAAMMVAAIKAYSPPADDIVLKTFVLLHAELAGRLASESKHA